MELSSWQEYDFWIRIVDQTNKWIRVEKKRSDCISLHSALLVLGAIRLHPAGRKVSDRRGSGCQLGLLNVAQHALSFQPLALVRRFSNGFQGFELGVSMITCMAPHNSHLLCYVLTSSGELLLADI
jgi:hypothetical protein